MDVPADYSGSNPKGVSRSSQDIGNQLSKSQKTPTWLFLIMILLFLFIESSCLSKKYNYANYKKLKFPSKVIKIQSMVVNNKFSINVPSNIAVINGYLIIGDYKADKLLKIIDLNSNELLLSFGDRGQAPDEFIEIGQIIPDPYNWNHFWIYDSSTSQLKQFKIDNILHNDFNPEKIINISTKNGYPAQLVILPDQKMLGIGLFWQGRVLVYDMNREITKTLGKIPPVIKNERFAAHYSHGFIGRLVYKNVSKEIYLSTRHGSIIEKYDVEGKLLATLIGPDPFFPNYDIVPARQGYAMTYNKKTRFGYLDIAYNQKLDRLFLLYSGKYWRNHSENIKVNFGKTIYVIDDHDTIVEQIELDKEIGRMCIDQESSAIFGLSENEVLKFDYKAK